MTSLAFMFDDVPEPVWKTSIGNWSSCLPSAISSPAAAIRSARSASSRPSSALTRAAAPLMRPSQRTTAHRDALAGHGEVVDGLAGLAAPELRGGVLHAHRGETVSTRAPGPGSGVTLRGSSGSPQWLQTIVGSAWWPHSWWSRSSGGPSSPARYSSPQRMIATTAGIEVAAHRGQLVLVALGLLLVADPLEDPGAGERLQAGREDVARDPEVALQLGEAADAEERLAHDQEGPALAEHLHRAADRTGLVLHHVTVSRWRSRSSTATTTCCSHERSFADASGRGPPRPRACPRRRVRGRLLRDLHAAPRRLSRPTASRSRPWSTTSRIGHTFAGIRKLLASSGRERCAWRASRRTSSSDGPVLAVMHIEGAEAIDPGARAAAGAARVRAALARPVVEPAERVRPRRAVRYPSPRPAG